jgi:hypothetical protein
MEQQHANVNSTGASRAGESSKQLRARDSHLYQLESADAFA